MESTNFKFSRDAAQFIKGADRRTDSSSSSAVSPSLRIAASVLQHRLLSVTDVWRLPCRDVESETVAAAAVVVVARAQPLWSRAVGRLEEFASRSRDRLSKVSHRVLVTRRHLRETE